MWDCAPSGSPEINIASAAYSRRSVVRCVGRLMFEGIPAPRPSREPVSVRKIQAESGPTNPPRSFFFTPPVALVQLLIGSLAGSGFAAAVGCPSNPVWTLGAGRTVEGFAVVGALGPRRDVDFTLGPVTFGPAPPRFCSATFFCTGRELSSEALKKSHSGPRAPFDPRVFRAGEPLFGGLGSMIDPACWIHVYWKGILDEPIAGAPSGPLDVAGGTASQGLRCAEVPTPFSSGREAHWMDWLPCSWRAAAEWSSMRLGAVGSAGSVFL